MELRRAFAAPRWRGCPWKGENGAVRCFGFEEIWGAHGLTEIRWFLGNYTKARLKGLQCREMKGGNGSDVVDGGGPPPPLWASRHPPQPPETTTTGICPAISGATPILSLL